VPSASLALGWPRVKGTSAALKKNVCNWLPHRPDVLRRMPMSCNVVFDVLRSFAMGEAVELPIRELATMCCLSYEQTRRALRRLEGAHLITWQRCGPGRGHRSVFQVRWTPPSFPQLNDSSPTRVRDKDSNAPSERSESFHSERGRVPSWQTRPVSEKARRRALGRIRSELRRWGLPPAVRGELMDALGSALTKAIRKRRIRTARELAQVAEFVITLVDESHPREVAKRGKRGVHSWAAGIVAQAIGAVLGELRKEKTERQATTERLARIRQEREEARRAWAELANQGAKLEAVGVRAARPSSPPPSALPPRPNRVSPPKPSPMVQAEELRRLEVELQEAAASGDRDRERALFEAIVAARRGLCLSP